ncbi:hypothetical protein BR93DRAFT_34377 [Coniochaeta sp. PMI_546]|nr:hypothetical protein BR93DRAFT_34377 [Coniochaeta sp. PMI_546]
MQHPFLFAGAILAALHGTTYATNPEDLKGVLSDTIVPTPELCRSLCEKNSACFYSLYHLQCDECWQMDCSLGNRSFGGTTDYTKVTSETIHTCNQTFVPKMPTSECKNLTATATITSAGAPTETGSGQKNSAVLGVRISLLSLGAAAVVAMISVA